MKKVWPVLPVVLLIACGIQSGETVPTAAAARGPHGTGFYAVKNLPTKWSEKDDVNILWKQKIKLPAWASPLVWGDKTIALGADGESRSIFCFDTATGESKWKTDIPRLEEAPEEYQTDTLDDRWNTLMYAASTPVTDGKHVVAMFSLGQLACVKLDTGEIVWNKFLADPGDNTYGMASALILFKDSVIVVCQCDAPFIARYNLADGKEIWKSKRTGSTWASPILITTTEGKPQVVLPAQPDVSAWDPENGTRLWSLKLLDGNVEYCVGPSPVYADGIVVINCQGCGIFGIDPVKGEKVWEHKSLPLGEDAFPDGVSMTTDGKHVYQFFQSILSCLEAKTGKVVKEKEMDDEARYASPFYNDGKLYLFATGMTIVCEADPAKDFATVGTGTIRDDCDANPAVIDGRIFLRSDSALYCIGNK